MHFVFLFHLAYVLGIYFIESTPGALAPPRPARALACSAPYNFHESTPYPPQKNISSVSMMQCKQFIVWCLGCSEKSKVHFCDPAT